MKDLCIAIIICNKDYQLLPELYRQIKERVHIDNYRIVCFDNRENQADYTTLYNLLPEITFYNKNHTNLYQFEGRRYLMEKVTDCKYWWFIDGDDEVLEFTYDLAVHNEDVIVFPHSYENIYTNQEDFRNAYKESPRALGGFGYCLWNKFFKHSVMNQYLDKLPVDARIVNGEDQIYCLILLKYCDQILYEPDIVPYCYHISQSASACESYKTIEQFTRIFIGNDIRQQIVERLLPTEQERIQVGLPPKIRYIDFFYFMKRLECCPKEIIDEAVDAISKIYTKEEILDHFMNPFSEISDELADAISRKFNVTVHRNPKDYMEEVVCKYINEHKNELGVKTFSDYADLQVVSKAITMIKKDYLKFY